MADSTEEQLAAYRASIERLTKANSGLRAEQKRMKWLGIATVVAAAITYVAYTHYGGVFVLIVGGSAFFVGHYVVYMHIHENKLTIKSARQRIASLSEAQRARLASPPLPPAAPGT